MKALVSWLCAAALSVGAAEANGIFLDSDIEGPRSETKDQSLSGLVRLSSIDWGLEQDDPRGTGGGVCRLTGIRAMRDIDGNSIDFIEAAATGRSIGRTAIIKLTRNLGYDRTDPDREFPVLELEIERAFLTSYATRVADDSYAMAETFGLVSEVATYRARAFTYNPNTGRLVSTREFSLPCGGGGV